MNDHRVDTDTFWKTEKKTFANAYLNYNTNKTIDVKLL